ncbi:MAG: GAF domain-containing sensor histidine kinase [Dokdonella sp.]
MSAFPACPPVPVNEVARLAALRSYGILDTPIEGAFDDVTRIAALICGAPIAVVNFIDSGRQWFKSEIGLGLREMPLGPSICAHAILQNELFIVGDTTQDSRFSANPLVTGDPGLRFYAGAPLLTPDGLTLGTVCVLDMQPRVLSDEQSLALKALARQVMAQLELRKALVLAERAAGFQKRLLAIVGHDLKTPLRSGGYAIEKVRREVGPELQKRLTVASDAFAQIDSEFNKLVALATTDEADGVPRTREFSLDSVLDPLLVPWRAIAQRKGLSLRYVRSSAVVESQPELLATIVGNFISNAIKYTEKGSVLIGCRRRRGSVVVEVIDTGVGIESARADVIFNAFQQGDPSSEGLGLGLWIASRTAAMLGHAVRMQSWPGCGTRFELELRQADSPHS